MTVWIILGIVIVLVLWPEGLYFNYYMFNGVMLHSLNKTTETLTASKTEPSGFRGGGSGAVVDFQAAALVVEA